MKQWEIWGASICLVGFAVLALCGKDAASTVFAVLSALFCGVLFGKHIYAPDEVKHPEAFRSLTHEEIAQRRQKWLKTMDM